MKIAILHPFTPQSAGVVEKRVSTYHSQPHAKSMSSLSSEGYECSMEYFTPRLFKYSFLDSNLKWSFFPVDFKFNGDHKKWKKQSSVSCLRQYKKDAPDVTIINMSGHSSPFSYDLSKVILQNNKPYIAMLGGQHYTNTKEVVEYYRNAHHILVHTHLQKAEMESMEMFRDLDIRVFPLGVNCDDFKPKPSIKATIDSPPKLLYVGRIVEWKRVHLAIEALYELVNNGFLGATLTIIGPVSSEDYQLKLKEMVKDKKLTENVLFLGHKEHYELPYYFQEADLFVLPSDKETFGMVMIESMACETPVAGMACPGGPADVIESGFDGLLSTPETYSKDILNLFRNRSFLDTMKINARKKVLDNYSIQETTRVLMKSVNDALKS